jgi:uncharacterized membrane protein YqaE (UPF0057 family)
MMYVLAVIFPPLVPLFKGKFLHFLLNCLLTAIGWLPGVVHAWVLVYRGNSERRISEMEQAIRRANEPRTTVLRKGL